ncbi:LacI family DNA-binding transcriptional regulator [Flaviaesturariibacter amylovorans]|uniref:LacI family DNA-binding transcriptional regulator n=1 Tax=Flaviaesturariibacter amylovorans TaxID=1084520 RepID=A0ABP8HS79_9BACT
MIRCKKCGEVGYIKKSGKVRGRQRYYCKDCKVYFSEEQEDKSPVAHQHQVTITDLARHLNLSASTVSRALHKHPDINLATQKKVLDLAARLDYQPNMLASSLVKSKSFTIGIVVPEFINSFFPNVILGAEEVLAKAGYKLVICHSNESYEREVENVKLLLSSRVDGFLISLTQETKKYDHLKAIVAKGIPLVLYNRICTEVDVPKVTVNDYEGAFKATEHLILNGYRKVAHIAGPQTLQIAQSRITGYKDALKKYEIPVNEDWIRHCDLSFEGAKRTAAYLFDLENSPDAIFAMNDTIAVEVIQLAKMRGISIPAQLAVVGFSDDIIAQFIGLTTMAQPVREIGKAAARLVLQRLKNRDVHIESKILSTSLVIRSSSSHNH